MCLVICLHGGRVFMFSIVWVKLRAFVFAPACIYVSGPSGVPEVHQSKKFALLACQMLVVGLTVLLCYRYFWLFS